MKILSYLPSEGWYFIYYNGQERVLSRVAAWAVVADPASDTPSSQDVAVSASSFLRKSQDPAKTQGQGRLVGMISVRQVPEDGEHLSLVLVPASTEGCYVHEHDLSYREREILKKYRGE